ncbi:MAG: recombinase family protein [Clostridia bacterium]|nr:recombinase family protein [Clostridia bacterium]
MTLDRPGLEMVTQAVLAGKVDMVLVNSIDRIGQEWDMTQAYIDLLTQHKVKLLCIRDRLLFDKQGVTYFEQIKKCGVPVTGYSDPIRTLRMANDPNYDALAQGGSLLLLGGSFSTQRGFTEEMKGNRPMV